jgi:hypothetical protein
MGHIEAEFIIAKKLVSTVGLEPTTTALKGRCSTIELRARLGKESAEEPPAHSV